MPPRKVLQPRRNRLAPLPFAWPVHRLTRLERLPTPRWLRAAARFLVRIAVFAMDPMLAVAKAAQIWSAVNW